MYTVVALNIVRSHLLVDLIGALTRRNRVISRSRLLLVCNSVGSLRARLETMKKRVTGQVTNNNGQRIGMRTQTIRYIVGLSRREMTRDNMISSAGGGRGGKIEKIC